MLKVHRYTILTDPDKPQSTLYFSQLGSGGDDCTDVLCVEESDEPKALGRLSRIAAFYSLLDAEVCDRAALGDFKSETLTRQDILTQVEKMLAEPEVQELLEQVTPKEETT